MRRARDVSSPEEQSAVNRSVAGSSPAVGVVLNSRPFSNFAEGLFVCKINLFFFRKKVRADKIQKLSFLLIISKRKSAGNEQLFKIAVNYKAEAVAGENITIKTYETENIFWHILTRDSGGKELSAAYTAWK